jgi:DNA-binding response OmpR family regulator
MGGVSAGTTVLVVDDDASLRLLCRVNLELEGYRVLEAATLEAAADALARDDVDVILLDVHVGSGDGRIFLRQLRDAGTDVRVALFTGSSKLEDDDREIADGVLPKPFPLEELTSTVERLARRVDVDSRT